MLVFWAMFGLGSSCGLSSTSTTDDLVAADLVGTWYVCNDLGTTSLAREIVFTSTTIQISTEFFSTNETCTGAADTTTDLGAGDFEVGSSRSDVGSGVYELDYDLTTVNQFQIVRLDTSEDPDELTLGDDTGANNGTSDVLRPDTLSTTLVFFKI